MFDTSVEKPLQYSLDRIKETALQLVRQGQLDRQQPIFTLCQYIPAREWPNVEWELELSDFLLRDRIIDLLAKESWDDD